MTKNAYFYDRAPSDQFMALLAPGGFLESLTHLRERTVAGLKLDVQLRANDEVHVYCGLTRLMVIRRAAGGKVLVTADSVYRKQDRDARFFKEWNGNESNEFPGALESYLRGVKVRSNHTAREGKVQSLWSKVTQPWTPIDREAVLGGRGKESQELKAARAELEDLAASQGESAGPRGKWSPPPARGREIDQLAVDAAGRLVLLELKDASSSSASVYYTPFQLLHYVWEWHDALECVRGRLQELIDARVALGLTPGPVPRITGGIRAAVCFGEDLRTKEVRRRYELVLDVANRHLPPCVPRIETWALESQPEPVRIAGHRPSPDPHRGSSKFAVSLQAHLEEWRAGLDGSRERRWPVWTDGIHPDYRQLAVEVVREDEVRLHTFADHLRSSQAFALNLFLPFRKGSRSSLSDLVSETIGSKFAVEHVLFEWVPPGALLGEIAGDRPAGDEPATAVDVALWGSLAGGCGAAVLLEVKLSEPDFTNCHGRTSRGNRRTDVCKSAAKFFRDPGACYLRRPLRKPRDRRYWEIFEQSNGSVRDAFPGADLDGQCPFAFSMQQPMRNLAIARGLEQCSRLRDRAGVVRTLRTRWQRGCGRSLGGVGTLASKIHPVAPKLTASQVLRAGEVEGFGEWAEWMRERYRL